MQGLESLNQFKKFVSSIGGLGRFEDTYIVHAAEGETVIPMEVLDRNPLLKKRLFKSMIEMGIEPGRYIVGNELNSKNPVTGQPEFFLKKVVDRLKKAAADVSGYAAPIVGAMYGPAAGALVGAGLGAFKRENPGDPSQWAQMAMLGGGSGIAANLLGGTPEGKNWLTGKGLSGRFGTDSPLDIGKRMLGMDKTYKGPKTEGVYDKWFGDTTKVPSAEEELINSEINRYETQLRDIEAKEAFSGRISQETIDAKNNLKEKIYLLEREKLQDIADADKKGLFGNMSLGEIAGLYGLGTAGLGFLIDRTTDQGDVGTRVDPYKEHGLDYGWEAPTIVYDYDRPIVPAMGHGGVMDLQGGGESMGPGTGTSDSIPAMLSDGEFVMTAKAVRGAGGGNRREGARKMYEAMDRLEARA